MENGKEKSMENEIDTGFLQGFIGALLFRSPAVDTVNPDLYSHSFQCVFRCFSI